MLPGQTKSLHARRWMQWSLRGMLLLMRELIFRRQTAARWKIACARLCDDQQALADAYRQLIAWLKKYPPSTPGKSWQRERPIDVENGYLECAIAEAELLLARTLGDRAAENVARDRTLAAARQLLRLTPSASIDPFEFDVARETATRLLLAESPAADKPELEAILLAADVELYESITDKTRALYEEGVRGGEAERMALVNIDLALARARLARLRGDRNDETLALMNAAALAKDVREAAEAAYNSGALTVCDFLQVNRRAAEVEIALARATGSREAEHAAQLAAEILFSDTWLKISTLDLHDLRWAGADLVRCLYGIEMIEQRGADFYEGPVRALEPLAKIPRRRVISEDADRAIEAARVYLEKERGEPVNASFAVHLRGDRYGVSVEFLDSDGQPSRPGGHCLIVVSKDWEASRYIAGE